MVSLPTILSNENAQGRKNPLIGNHQFQMRKQRKQITFLESTKLSTKFRMTHFVADLHEAISINLLPGRRWLHVDCICFHAIEKNVDHNRRPETSTVGAVIKFIFVCLLIVLELTRALESELMDFTDYFLPLAIRILSTALYASVCSSFQEKIVCRCAFSVQSRFVVRRE